MLCVFRHLCSSWKNVAPSQELRVAPLVWPQVINAEMARRRLLEDTPIDSLREDPVQFDTAEIPWWAWVRRFHLPEVLPSATNLSAHVVLLFTAGTK